MAFYDGTKLLSLKDINGDLPEMYMCTTNRSAGKTTFFNRMVVKKFLNTGEKFALLYRFNYELDSISDKFFKDIQKLFFPDYIMDDASRMKGMYRELFIGHNKEDMGSCGYAITLNSADQLKKYSHLLSDVKRIIFDEFQSESNHYCANELNKFLSIHKSIARGQGEQVRYVPVYMLSNAVSIINPYYTQLDIANRLNSNTNYLRGEGWVLENGFNPSAAEAQEKSAISRAFKNTEYIAYSTQNVYLNDNTAFIEEPPKEYGKYLCTLNFEHCNYGIITYESNGIVYVTDRYDKTSKTKLCVTTDDHQINYVMLKMNDAFIIQLRFFFEKGCCRFKNIKCKNAFLKAISY